MTIWAYQWAEARRDDNRQMAKKRGYSREFKPHGNTGKRYLLDDIPAGLWNAAREKAKREGVSMRALLLTLLERWVEPTGGT